MYTSTTAALPFLWDHSLLFTLAACRHGVILTVVQYGMRSLADEAMKLPSEFCRLRARFDAERLMAEVKGLPDSAWHRHPLSYTGNRAVRLISGRGEENDDMGGVMATTPHLEQCPYIRQTLASFGVAWSRSRLMLLAAGSEVPQHCDVNYHWFTRVRVHIPIITSPAVLFYCGSQRVHMAAGEAWIFDNWRPHKVVNGGYEARVHLVADTVGNAAFWDMAAAGQWRDFDTDSGIVSPVLRFEAGPAFDVLTERRNVPVVMHPGELQWLVDDFAQDLTAVGTAHEVSSLCSRIRSTLASFIREWRHLWALHGDGPEGHASFLRARDAYRRELIARSGTAVMRSNQLSAMQVLDGRVLRYCISPPGAEPYRRP